MATTIKQTEAIPVAYPDVSPWNRLGHFAGEDVAPVAAQLWQRIEAYIAYRYTPRAVVWIVEGEGDWTPPLAPAIVTQAEKWEGETWVTVTLPDGPYGYCLPSDGPYRITADVGGGDMPEAVVSAFQRLHEYTRGINDSFKNEAASLGGGENEMVRNWTAKSMQLSGAADLLRSYRRVQ